MAGTEQLLRAAFKLRGFLCLVDDMGSGEQCVLTAPAEGITSTTVNELLHLTHGVLFVALGPQRVRDFFLEQVRRETVGRSTPRFDTLVSVEAREGVTTGISAADRAATIRVLGEPEPRPRQLVRPGHIFPVATREGGTLVRPTLPEGAVDIARIVGKSDAAVFVDILCDNGEALNGSTAPIWCRERGIACVALSELVQHRLEHEQMVTRVAEAKLPTEAGTTMRSFVYQTKFSAGEHIAVVCGDVSTSEPVLTRVQAEYTFSDVFGGTTPPSRRSLHSALRAIGERGRGVVVYLRRNDVGQLREQVSSWERASQTRPAAIMREYGVGAQVLRDLGVHRIELLTNAPAKIVGLDSFGIEVVRTLPLPEHET